MSKKKPSRKQRSGIDKDRYGRGLTDPLPAVDPESNERTPAPDRPELKKFYAPLWAGGIVRPPVLGVFLSMSSARRTSSPSIPSTCWPSPRSTADPRCTR